MDRLRRLRISVWRLADEEEVAMRRESRPPPEESPPASGPKERRDEFLRARGLDEEGADSQGRMNEPGEDVDESCPDDTAVGETDVDLEEESMDS